MRPDAHLFNTNHGDFMFIISSEMCKSSLTLTTTLKWPLRVTILSTVFAGWYGFTVTVSVEYWYLYVTNTQWYEAFFLYMKSNLIIAWIYDNL